MATLLTNGGLISTANTVLYRGLALGLLFVRFTIEFGTKGRGLIESTDLYTIDQMTHIINSSLDLRKALTSEELKALTEVEIGGWENHFIAQASWYSEACGCVLWSVGEIDEFPQHDTPFSLKILNKYFKNVTDIQWALPFSHHLVAFRERSKILREKKRAEIVLQRCIYGNEIRSKGRHLPLDPYENIFYFSTWGLPTGSSGDLLVAGTEFCDVGEGDEQTLFTISLCRAHALNWCLSPEIIWGEIDLSYLYSLPQ